MQQSNVMATMVPLQRRLSHHSDNHPERQFFSHALRYVTTTSGRQVALENWMIASYETDFGPLIGSDGLCIRYFCGLLFCLRTDSDNSG